MLLHCSCPCIPKPNFLPDSSQLVSFVHGPVVLAAATDTTGLEGLLADGSRMGHIAAGPLIPLEKAPLAVADQNQLAAAIKTGRQDRFTFKAPGLFDQAKYRQLTLQPFFTITTPAM